MIQTQPQSAQIYTDLNALQGIRTLGKNDKSAALMEVAKQFESMFMNMMMSSMRDANKVFEEDSMFNSPETDFYRKMYDDQMALSLSGQQGTGLSQVIYRQLMANYGDHNNSPKELDQSKLFDRRARSPLSVSEPSHIRTSPLTATALSATMDEVDTELHQLPAAAEKTIEIPLVAASGSGNKGQQFATPADFVAALYPLAEKVGAELGVEPKAIVAQAALETGWGKYMITDEQGRNSFNFFGIKADKRWQGDKVEVITHEFRDGQSVKERAEFRSYTSMEEGLRDYANFLQGTERYQSAIGQNLSASHYGHALQQAGYATDPQYGAKIQRISQSTTLNSALEQLRSSERLSGGRNDG
ncbi:MAG: flagellar assembly peptidoglycan hydrolase FlgJ [Saccharospirillaceae bacterium]|nr:flagellar assembly peptidoglycan hydrolase FlgJ [Saccharospirillaceae bacterium]MCD8530943.1 flagellar assembly peptidoglycan hydrolase FlgJ [Saccharospirillaceae bacterium]